MSNIDQIFEDLHSRRILVVDDNKFVAEHIAERLSETYARVDYISDPRAAIELVLEAIAGDTPIDSLVLDLDMPGVNGIELLKQLNRKGVSIPTVVFSGEQGDYLAVPLIHQLNRAGNEQELDSLVGEIADDSEGLPITYLKKFEGNTPILDLTNAIDAMGLVALRSQTAFDDFISRLEAKQFEYHFDSPHIAQMADIVKLTRVRFMELGDRLLQYKPFMRKKAAEKLFATLGWFISDLESDRFTAQGLSDPIEGRSNIHSLEIYYNPNLISSTLESRIPGPDELLLSRFNTQARCSGIVELRDDFAHTHKLLAKAFEYNRLCQGDYSTVYPFNLEEQVEVIVTKYIFPFDVKVETNYQAVDRDVLSEPYLTGSIVINVLMNALEAAKDSEEKRVYVETSVIPISELGETESSFFKSHGYHVDSEIVQVLIEDTGSGIPPENLEKITQEGFSTKGSTGYGLAFVHQKIGEIPGTYRIESKVRVGTKFFLYFPVHAEEKTKQ